jgi:hypothetical protein
MRGESDRTDLRTVCRVGGGLAGRADVGFACVRNWNVLSIAFSDVESFTVNLYTQPTPDLGRLVVNTPLAMSCAFDPGPFPSWHMLIS